MRLTITVVFIVVGLIAGLACSGTPEVEQLPASPSASQATPAEPKTANTAVPTETPMPPTATAVPPTMTPRPISSPVSRTPTPKYESFFMASRGEYWIIDDDDIAALIHPERPINSMELLANLSAIIEPGTMVQIRGDNDPGLFSADFWKEVYVIDENGIPYATGWIATDTVDKARCVRNCY